MILQIRRLILLLGLLWLPSKAVLAQFYSSNNNYTGGWEMPSSWNPPWTVPQTTNLSGHDISINGYITVNGSLSFSGTTNNLIINDTLVIKGNLLLGNNTKLTVNNNGILIVRGTLTISNQTISITNNYIIVTGDIIKSGSSNQGTFTSSGNPVRLFIGGNISPVELANNHPNFPVFNCTAPLTIPYPNSKCSYGNMTDIINDPIYPFFKTICPIANVNSNISVCDGSTLNLTSAIGITYSWSGPNGFASREQNPSLPNSNSTMAGAYVITVNTSAECTDIDTINVTVNIPIATAGSNSPICSGNTINFTSSNATSFSWSGPNGFTSNLQNPIIPIAADPMEGTYAVTITAANGCKVTKTTNVIVNALPTASIIITDNSDIANDGIIYNGTTASLTASGGTSYIWSSGETTAVITKDVEGTYTVTVTNALGCANQVDAEVKITVYDPFIPSVITPDGDGKNDYFKISEKFGQVALIIFNRWGVEEYTNSNYENNWDGRNNKGLELPNDTYFYILKFENIKIKKGSVLIKR